jgi:hypothetical protein
MELSGIQTHRPRRVRPLQPRQWLRFPRLPFRHDSQFDEQGGWGDTQDLSQWWYDVDSWALLMGEVSPEIALVNTRFFSEGVQGETAFAEPCS